MVLNGYFFIYRRYLKQKVMYREMLNNFSQQPVNRRTTVRELVPKIKGPAPGYRKSDASVPAI